MASCPDTTASRAPRQHLAGPYTLGVIVPAHNEAALIMRCLNSLRRAEDELHRSCLDPPAVRVLVVLDACTDGTAGAVAAVPGVGAVAVGERRAGAARRAGAERALAEAPGRLRWLASTDADSTVPAHWLTSMVALARGGADLVLGTVEPEPGLPPELLRRWRIGYRNADGHPHVHGANLGISASAYRRLGGWPRTSCHEDVILAHRAVTAGLSIVRTGSITVTTSSRLTGRAPSGFAAHLAALASRSG